MVVGNASVHAVGWHTHHPHHVAAVSTDAKTAEILFGQEFIWTRVHPLEKK